MYKRYRNPVWNRHLHRRSRALWLGKPVVGKRSGFVCSTRQASTACLIRSTISRARSGLSVSKSYRFVLTTILNELAERRLTLQPRSFDT